MRIHFKIFGKNLIMDYGFKQPDFVTAEDVRQYAKVEQLSKKLIKLHHKLLYSSKRLGVTEIYTRNLTQSELKILESKGFNVTVRTRTKKGNTTVMMNHYRISS